LVARSVWGGRVKGSNPLCPIYKTLTLLKMDQELNKLESFTVEEFQADFDALLNRVEKGRILSY
jgi:hypothetical protein